MEHNINYRTMKVLNVDYCVIDALKNHFGYLSVGYFFTLTPFNTSTPLTFTGCDDAVSLPRLNENGYYCLEENTIYKIR